MGRDWVHQSWERNTTISPMENHNYDDHLGMSVEFQMEHLNHLSYSTELLVLVEFITLFLQIRSGYYDLNAYLWYLD